jgi:hypothetical protein
VIYQPRRPLDEDKPDGYMESDTDYLLNNREIAVALLDAHKDMIAALLALTTHDRPVVVHVAQSALNKLPKELIKCATSTTSADSTP